MERKIVAGIRTLYSTTKETQNVIRLRIKMSDSIDLEIFRYAVDTTMKRYPFFLVELKKRDGQYVFIDNPRPVVISNSLHGVDLNTEESNYHMVAFSWQNDWISMDIFHGLTDGIGAYEVVRTLLYYYCSKRYNTKLNKEGIRLIEDSISDEEWIDPVEAASNLPNPIREEISNALNLVEAAELGQDNRKTVYSIAISESEFMHFNIEKDGSPGTMVSLLLSRAIAKMYPKAQKPIRIALCVNQRTA